MTQETNLSLSPQAFLTSTLEDCSWGAAVTRILAAAIQAVEPGYAVSRYLHRQASQLTIDKTSFDLDQIEHVWIAAVGKASLPMASAAAKILGEKLSGGLVVAKEGFLKSSHRGFKPVRAFQTNSAESSEIEAFHRGLSLPDCLQVIEAGHPIPNRGSLQAASAMRKLLEGAGSHDLILGLISGGGSALLASPAFGLHLDDLQRLTKILLASGASIQEINILRKHLEELKGGRMAQLAAPAHLVCLVLSDVIGDPLDMIASGPCVADASSYADASRVLEEHKLTSQVPRPILETIQNGLQGELPETPKPGDPIFDKVKNLIIGNNKLAAHAALEQAQREGFQTLLLQSNFEGESSQVGQEMAAILERQSKYTSKLARPLCIIAGGETTVSLHGSGKGGRNQELALATVKPISALKDVILISLATDGEDGPTDAAGAVVSQKTLIKAQALGLDPDQYLACNDAYHFFEPLGDLIRCGPTHTNVNDLVLMFAL